VEKRAESNKGGVMVNPVENNDNQITTVIDAEQWRNEMSNFEGGFDTYDDDYDYD